MELLLNLAWILLALPAYWLWRRDRSSRLARCVSPLQCFLTLGCVLVLLFPVISASDDLHAMRAEMEESTSKRAVRQASGDKSAAAVKRLTGPAVMAARAIGSPVLEIAQLEILVISVSPRASSFVLYAGRAPPVSLLG